MADETDTKDDPPTGDGGGEGMPNDIRGLFDYFDKKLDRALGAKGGGDDGGGGGGGGTDDDPPAPSGSWLDRKLW